MKRFVVIVEFHQCRIESTNPARPHTSKAYSLRRLSGLLPVSPLPYAKTQRLKKFLPKVCSMDENNKLPEEKEISRPDARAQDQENR